MRLKLVLCSFTVAVCGVIASPNTNLPNYVFKYTVDDPNTNDRKTQYERKVGKEITNSYAVKTIHPIPPTGGPNAGTSYVGVTRWSGINKDKIAPGVFLVKKEEGTLDLSPNLSPFPFVNKFAPPKDDIPPKKPYHLPPKKPSYAWKKPHPTQEPKWRNDEDDDEPKIPERVEITYKPKWKDHDHEPKIPDHVNIGYKKDKYPPRKPNILIILKDRATGEKKGIVIDPRKLRPNHEEKDYVSVHSSGHKDYDWPKRYGGGIFKKIRPGYFIPGSHGGNYVPLYDKGVYHGFDKEDDAGDKDDGVYMRSYSYDKRYGSDRDMEDDSDSYKQYYPSEKDKEDKRYEVEEDMGENKGSKDSWAAIGKEYGYDSKDEDSWSKIGKGYGDKDDYSYGKHHDDEDDDDDRYSKDDDYKGKSYKHDGKYGGYDGDKKWYDGKANLEDKEYGNGDDYNKSYGSGKEYYEESSHK